MGMIKSMTAPGFVAFGGKFFFTLISCAFTLYPLK